jgi:hypothetical protein
LSWCSFRQVAVGVIVRNHGRVLWNGIPDMEVVVNNQFTGGAIHAEDPVFGVTPGPAHTMAKIDVSASQGSPVRKSEQSFPGDCKAH